MNVITIKTHSMKDDDLVLEIKNAVRRYLMEEDIFIPNKFCVVFYGDNERQLYNITINSEEYLRKFLIEFKISEQINNSDIVSFSIVSITTNDDKKCYNTICKVSGWDTRKFRYNLHMVNDLEISAYTEDIARKKAKEIIESINKDIEKYGIKIAIRYINYVDL